MRWPDPANRARGAQSHALTPLLARAALPARPPTQAALWNLGHLVLAHEHPHLLHVLPRERAILCLLDSAPPVLCGKAGGQCFPCVQALSMNVTGHQGG